MTVHKRSAHVLLFFTLLGTVCHAAEYSLHTFDRQQLTDVYFSEGAHAGDLNGDGRVDVVYGPYWFEGPEYTTKHEIYEPKPQNREAYADSFFSWVYDFNEDGWNDVFVVGFPGTPAYVYENPGAGNFGQHWPKHEVFDWVSNESPQFTNLIGDERPELVCTRDGFFGFATVNWDQPFETWRFHPISARVTSKRFGHGLGVGDIDGDGRLDIIHANGWLRQPERNPERSRWASNETSFTNSYGGADMHAYDVDGDGDNDVITSHAAHDFGLGWYEQRRDGDEITFEHHLIMGSHPADNAFGVLFSELHSVILADFDGDGLKDIVTGKTFYSHHRQSPMWDAGAVVYWFRLVRDQDGVHWVPYKADDQSGIGRQLSVLDTNGDGLLDIVVGGMKGAHVLTHRKTIVDKTTWLESQPQPYAGDPAPSAEGAKALRGPKATFASSRRVNGAIEGEDLPTQTQTGQAQPQSMSGFSADRWSGDAQLFWTGARPGDTLKLSLPRQSGIVDVQLVMTCARDYGIVQLSLDDQPLGKPIDLYSEKVMTTGVLTFPNIKLKDGPHTFSVQIVGANPMAAKAYMFGLDFVRLEASADLR